MVSGQSKFVAVGRQTQWHRDGKLVVDPSKQCPRILINLVASSEVKS